MVPNHPLFSWTPMADMSYMNMNMSLYMYTTFEGEGGKQRLTHPSGIPT